MTKVEAVVIRERVETVIDAVEEETGPRRRDGDRGGRPRPPARRHARVPRPRVRVALPAEGAAHLRRRRRHRRGGRRGDRRRRAQRQRVGRRPRVDDAASRTSPTTAPGWRLEEVEVAMTTQRPRPIAANTVWVVVAAVLVMFMQAGFAFLEAGLTRMKNAGAHRRQERAHLRRLLDRLLGGRLRDRLRRRQRVRRHARLLPVGRTRCSPSARRRSTFFTTIPGAAGYLFEVVFAGVSLAIVWGAMAERAKLWVYFVFGAIFTVIYSVVSHWIWHSRRLALRQGHAGLRRLDGRPLPGRARGARRRAAPRPAHRQVRARTGARTRSPATTCRTPCSGR